MKAEVLALVDELKRLRGKGVDRVFVSDEAVQSLRKLGRGQSLSREKVLESIPDQVRSASASEFGKLVTESKTPAGAAAIVSKGKKKPALPKPPVIDLPDGDKQSRWNALREIVLNCRESAKRLQEGSKVVFGAGDLDADIFFCGEAPGMEDETEGKIFIGPPGELLGKMLSAAGLSRETVYLGNVMNWRPSAANANGNRPPNTEEIGFCMPYLKAQIEVVKPKLIVALGVVAAKGLLGHDAFKNLRDIKGQWQEFEGIPVMPTYHPSYLIRNTSKRDKRAAWEDWLKVMEKAELPISDRQRGFFL